MSTAAAVSLRGSAVPTAKPKTKTVHRNGSSSQMFCLTESTASSSYLCPQKTEDCGDVVEEEEAAAAAAKTVPFSLAMVVVVHYTV